MSYDQAGQGWVPKSGVTLLELAYTYDIVDLPRSGVDMFRVPSHFAKPDLTMLGALTCDAGTSGSQYTVMSYYYGSRPEYSVVATYAADIQEGRQFVTPNSAVDGWVKDYAGVWHNLGHTSPTDATKIGRFDILAEIYYTGSMDLPSSQHNHAYIRWARTQNGWQKPQDVIQASGSTTQGTWARCSWAWENSEIHFQAWIA